MNKLFALTMVFALLVVGMVAAVPIGTTYVTGQVTDNSNNPVSNVTLSIICNSEITTAITDGSGDYLVGLNDPTCGPGATAYVTATAYDVTNSGKVCNGPNKDDPQCEGINLALVNLQIPEFGVIAGAVALIGALGIFAFRRK
jgi:hypothetical protein